MSHLRRREKMNDVDAWTYQFLDAMNSSLLTETRGGRKEAAEKRHLMPKTTEDFDDFLIKYIGDADKLALVLDYDG